MSWLREIFWLCFIHNIEIYATYIKSEDNILADQLSRLNYKNVPAKCNKTLLEYGMCCTSRLKVEESEDNTEELLQLDVLPAKFFSQF